MNCVQLSQVEKTFGKHRAVYPLDLAVPKGSIYGFIGPNGSGKTTTLRMILHIIPADAGTVQVLGSVTERATNDRIGYLPEERGIYRKMTVLRQLIYSGRLKGMSAANAKKQVLYWLEKLGLSDWSGKKIETLSKGMAQKVQFIAAVISDPELLILDEPFSGLDPVNLETLKAAILELHEAGTTIIFSTHDMSMAQRMCDYVFMIHKGHKVLDASVDSILAPGPVRTLRLAASCSDDQLRSIAGVQNVTKHGRFTDVHCDGDPQTVLQSLLSHGPVEHFEVVRPTLHDIFLREAGYNMEESLEESIEPTMDEPQPATAS